MTENKESQSSAFHFPILFLVPEFESAEVTGGGLALGKRLWSTSTFDLATLATRHKLHVPYQAMDVFLSRCNLEAIISNTQSKDEAIRRFETFRLALYACGVSPFICPFITSHSINDYSGINSRDSEYLRAKLPEDMQRGFTSDSGTVEAWPYEMSLRCILDTNALGVTEQQFQRAIGFTELWNDIAARFEALNSIENAASVAPTILPLSQSFLHIWSALESLFPGVHTEVSFRISIYIAQLVNEQSGRKELYSKVKKSYDRRSRIAHGSIRDIDFDTWHETWSILMKCCRAIVERQELPSEDTVIKELLP